MERRRVGTLPEQPKAQLKRRGKLGATAPPGTLRSPPAPSAGPSPGGGRSRCGRGAEAHSAGRVGTPRGAGISVWNKNRYPIVGSLPSPLCVCQGNTPPGSLGPRCLLAGPAEQGTWSSGNRRLPPSGAARRIRCRPPSGFHGAHPPYEPPLPREGAPSLAWASPGRAQQGQHTYPKVAVPQGLLCASWNSSMLKAGVIVGPFTDGEQRVVSTPGPSGSQRWPSQDSALQLLQAPLQRGSRAPPMRWMGFQAQERDNAEG